MTKQHLPLLYFGLFAAYLTVFNWGNSLIQWYFLTGAALAALQIVHPRQAWVKPLLGLAILFSLGYAGSLFRTMFDAGSVAPFLTSESNRMFTWNCAVALLNFCMVLFWFKKGKVFQISRF